MLNANTVVSSRGSRECQSDRARQHNQRRGVRKGGEEICTTDATLLALGMEDKIPTKECGWPLEAEKGKETGSPLEPPEGISPYTLILELLNSRSLC